MALTISGSDVYVINKYVPKGSANLVAVTVPSAGVPILTAAPSAMIKMEVEAVGGFENVIWSFVTVYDSIGS